MSDSSPLSTPPSSSSSSEEERPARAASPPSPMTSTTIPPPSPLLYKPRLQDFVYNSQPFPASAPAILPTSTPLEITIAVVARMLQSKGNNIALAFMVEHQVVHRLFKPRLVAKGFQTVEADYTLRHQYSASAMAWYLLDTGQDMGRCSACDNELSLGPFEECFVPTAPRAKGSCTNCFFMGRSAMCPHRTRRSRTSTQSFAGLREVDVRRATAHTLSRWEAQLESEIGRREQQAVVPRQRGRRRWDIG